MCFIWSNKLLPAIAGARFVVSDNGDILSPKYAPDIIAPAIIVFGIPKALPIPSSAIPIVPTVVHDEPVEIETIEQITVVATKNILGDNKLSPQ